MLVPGNQNSEKFRTIYFITNDFNKIIFYFKQGARQQSRMQELQSHIERMNRDKMALEAKIVELSSYQNEVVSLRSEMSKLQVSVRLLTLEVC